MTKVYVALIILSAVNAVGLLFIYFRLNEIIADAKERRELLELSCTSKCKRRITRDEHVNRQLMRILKGWGQLAAITKAAGTVTVSGADNVEPPVTGELNFELAPDEAIIIDDPVNKDG